jgi:hypothetical protein
MLQEYDVVLLKHPTPTIPLPAGTKGAVLIVYSASPPAYEVEFIDNAGVSLGTFTAQETDLELVETR